MIENTKTLLTVEHLSIEFGNQVVVDDVNFSLKEGEILGIVGESGSGKTMSALAIMGLLDKKAKTSGSIVFDDKKIFDITKEEHRKLKGKEMGMIFQEPMTSFNPLLTIGQQLEEVFLIHEVHKDKKDIKSTIYDALRKVGLESCEVVYHSYPHELSGGMRQRAMIAMAMLLRPKLLIADEPTTALDVTVQKKILELMKQLNAEYGTSIILISHDLGVIHSISDRMIVMQSGKIVEQGISENVFCNPKEAYTKNLLASIPRKKKRDKNSRLLGKPYELGDTGLEDIENSSLIKGVSKNILEVKNLSIYYEEKSNHPFSKRGRKKVVENISFSLLEGNTLGIVGESGSGKSTIAKAVVGLNSLVDGVIDLKYKKPQMVFQDPYSSLNPTKKVRSILEEPLIIEKIRSKKVRREKVNRVLNEVGLSSEYGERYIHQLSGGQRQRIAIGVALIQNTKFIVLDEPVSALDVTVQAQILELLRILQIKYNLTYLFISHDLNIVYQICDQVIVMEKGRMVESGTPEEVLDHPKSEYTKELIRSILTI